MSQKVADILLAVSQLNNAEKAELLHRIGNGGFGGRIPGNEEFRNKGEGMDAINFAPRSRGKCPACGR
ncbi:hypothetical protein C9I94_24420 [Photobacterium swingsii]|uniref:Uncharacterized protein n=1 Tax=Photobacterium swingsii TaxID=680026 RepID=A0A2T3NQV1_9GAMM|nr:hypothetical protein [Photobacterium swingsii]PSW18654.1 hypothetical protein C9I94_24420 [Photobacterium swingsii]